METPEEPRIVLTREQLDESTAQRYWIHAAEYGIEYYIAGRYATYAYLTPICSNLLHHSIEMLLKSALAYEASWKYIRSFRNFPGSGHDIRVLWWKFLHRPKLKGEGKHLPDYEPDATVLLTMYGKLIEELHQWENVRYPEKLIVDGGAFNVSSILDLQPHEMTTGGNPYMTRYQLVLPQIDRLVTYLFKETHLNPNFTSRWNQYAAAYLWLHNGAPPIPQPTAANVIAQSPPERAQDAS